MIQLKEALIGKNNIKNASRSNKVYCVAVYDDDLDLRHVKEFTHVRSKDHIDVFVGSQDAVIKYADEIDKMETDIGCIKNPELSIQDVVDYLKRNDWLRDCERMCDRCFTAHIDEAFINKRTINNVSGYKNIYCIANYGEKNLDHIKEFIKVKCKDWVEVYVVGEEDFYKHLRTIKDLFADVGRVKNPSMSINDVLKYLKSHDWYKEADREICEKIYVDNIKESLIGKHNINNVDTQYKTIWWIISPSDEEVWELSIELKANNCNSIPYHTTDGVTCFIVSEDKVKNLNLNNFNELVFSKSKKKMTYSEVVKVVTHSDYYSNTTWDKYFNDNLEDWWTNESLIGKSNVKNAGTKRELYVLLVTSERTVRAIKNELKDYLYDNDYFYTWILTKSQIKEIYDKHSEIKEDRWLSIYRFRDQNGLDIMKSCPKNMEFRKIENRAGLIEMTPKEIYETILK